MALENFGVDKSTADKIGAATQIGLSGYVGKDLLTKRGRAELFGTTKGKAAVPEKSGLGKRQQSKLEKAKIKLKAARLSKVPTAAEAKEIKKLEKSVKYYEDLEKKKFRPARPAVKPKTKPPGLKGYGKGAMALLPMAMGLYDWFNEE